MGPRLDVEGEAQAYPHRALDGAVPVAVETSDNWRGRNQPMGEVEPAYPARTGPLPHPLARGRIPFRGIGGVKRRDLERQGVRTGRDLAQRCVPHALIDLIQRAGVAGLGGMMQVNRDTKRCPRNGQHAKPVPVRLGGDSLAAKGQTERRGRDREVNGWG